MAALVGMAMEAAKAQASAESVAAEALDQVMVAAGVDSMEVDGLEGTPERASTVAVEVVVRALAAVGPVEEGFLAAAVVVVGVETRRAVDAAADWQGSRVGSKVTRAQVVAYRELVMMVKVAVMEEAKVEVVVMVEAVMVEAAAA